MKKILIITLTVMLMLSLSARNGNAASGVAGVGQQLATAQSPSGNIRAKLVGEWLAAGAFGSSNYDPYKREITDYRNTRGNIMTFTDDGKIVSGSYSSSTIGYITTVFSQFYAADYEVVGNTVKLKNITYESFSNNESRGIMGVDNFEFQFAIGTDSSGEYLITNFRNERPLTLDEQLDYRKSK